MAEATTLATRFPARSCEPPSPAATATARYNWQAALANGESFESMNDEERAKVMEDIGVALKDDGQITTADGYTTAQVDFLSRDRREGPPRRRGEVDSGIDGPARGGAVAADRPTSS